MGKLKFGGPSPSKVLTQWVCLAILVRDGEDSDNGVAVLPQLLVNLLSEQTLTNHCYLHLHTSLFWRGSNTHQDHHKMSVITTSNQNMDFLKNILYG